ncbi:DPP IV N-terminal domain-containing protein [uncultured Hyphomonas sp.]|uniref:S9 family peptidase n=1 Tax=uncultured Hyphomonas sp. TaxID=225298 RepID=UPI002AABF639|nr:DPP IV N-terminal domain-containing protein [uncultured Hyphomonas sp.]
MYKVLGIIALALLCCGHLKGAAESQEEKYQRAERFLPWNKQEYMRNGDIQHHWIGDSDRFWYLRTTEAGKKQFITVDAETGELISSFNQNKLASALAKILGRPVDADDLPFNLFRFVDDEKVIELDVDGKLLRCRLSSSAQCKAVELPYAANEVVSPDGKWAVSLSADNLYIRNLETDKKSPLTDDGMADFAYAGQPGDALAGVSRKLGEEEATPEVIWSPNSRYILSHRIDERKVGEFHLVQAAARDGVVRPTHYAYHFSTPDEEHIALLHPVVFDVESGTQVDLKVAPVERYFGSLIANEYTWWSADGTTVYFINRGRYSKAATLVAADPETGDVNTLIEEQSDTWVRLGDGGLQEIPNVKTLSNGNIIWFSERDGWGHLYLVDGRTGCILNQITKGEWVVRDIIRVDEESETVYFTAGGVDKDEDPYLRKLYAVKFDGSGLTLLTPEAADHEVHIHRGFMSAPVAALSSKKEESGFSPSGRYFVDSYSSTDMPPRLVLRRSDGALVRELEAADISKLENGGYVAVERFEALAADGVTRIYGNLMRPSDFDPSKNYPIIDSIYPGPQISRVWSGFSGGTFNDPFSAQALAETGFIVVAIDGRGTPHRSKAFYDDSYGHLGKAGNLEDHIAVIRQLAARNPYMDIERVGIWGASGGGYASTRAVLQYPEFFKVAVSAAGNHDQRGYGSAWGEIYNGQGVDEDKFDAASNPLIAHQLKGKLLLVHGEMDDNVNPALTMQVVDALIQANKDFDLLIIPNGGHRAYRQPYFIRRLWDYFVENLQGVDPPQGYEIGLN